MFLRAVQVRAAAVRVAAAAGRGQTHPQGYWPVG